MVSPEMGLDQAISPPGSCQGDAERSAAERADPPGSSTDTDTEPVPPHRQQPGGEGRTERDFFSFLADRGKADGWESTSGSWELSRSRLS